MITLITGLPGSGKTLNAIAEIDQEWSGKREIWYVSKENYDDPVAGISDLDLDGWLPFIDPLLWWECPQGSVIVIDECQYCFPKDPKRKGKEPLFIQSFAEHRKKDFDVYLITQDALNIDHFIRRLIGRHITFWRPWGASYSTRTEYPRVVRPNDKSDQKLATSKKVVKFPKKYFGAYKSAFAHTVKFEIPKKVWIFAFFFFIFVYGIYSAFAIFSKKSSSSVPAVSVSAASVPAASVPAASVPSKKLENEKVLEKDGRIEAIIKIGVEGIAHVSINNELIRIPLRYCFYSQDYLGWFCVHKGIRYKQYFDDNPSVPSVPSVIPVSSSTSASQFNPFN